MISLKLTDSISDISKNINRVIVEEINAAIRPKIGELTSNVKQLVSTAIESQPEIQSLKDGLLKGSFGIIDGESAASNVTQSIINSVNVQFTRFNNTFNGGLTVNIQPSSFSNLLSLRSGFTSYEGGELHWLDWLLLKGDTIVVIDYQYNPKTGLGRSKLGNMINGGSFRVPPQFSGSEDDNFITRALINSDIENKIYKMLEEAIS